MTAQAHEALVIEPLQVGLQHVHGVPVLVVTGDLDLFSAKQLQTQGAELVEAALSPSADPGPATTEPAGTAAGSLIPEAAPPVASGSARPSRGWVPEVLVLDVSAVPFTDSAGLGAMISVLKRAQAHRAGLSIAGASEHLRAVLALMGLDKIVMLHASAQDAVQAALGSSDS